MMDRRLRTAVMAFGALLVLGAINMAIAGKERIRRHGEPIYLQLAPVDPRSLMQGDYMALQFTVARSIEQGFESGGPSHGGTSGVAALSIDAQRVATLAGESNPPSMTLRYRIRNGRVWLGTNAFFFEEGSAERFGRARYGEFRVDRISGEAVLVGLRDIQLNAL